MKDQGMVVGQSRKLGTGTWLSSGSAVIAELVSNLPFSWLLFDLEHGCLTEASLLSNLQAVRRNDVHLIVRVPCIDKPLINRILDWGASGIMIPGVRDQAMAERSIQAICYPPRGNRGYSGTTRAYGYGLRRPADAGQHPKPLLIAQIEDHEGVSNIDAIAGVEGVDILFAGPSDLTLNLDVYNGKYPLNYDEALQKIVNAALKHKKQAGILVSDTSQWDAMKKSGFTCCAVMSDLGVLREGYLKMFNEIT